MMQSELGVWALAILELVMLTVGGFTNSVGSSASICPHVPAAAQFPRGFSLWRLKAPKDLQSGSCHFVHNCGCFQPFSLAWLDLTLMPMPKCRSVPPARNSCLKPLCSETCKIAKLRHACHTPNHMAGHQTISRASRSLSAGEIDPLWQKEPKVRRCPERCSATNHGRFGACYGSVTVDCVTPHNKSK